ncbi:hypothetical protein TKK_0016138 [Trichogramma kaykai]|uniref:Uncharacterized protein n=1 Tax=Trichogramma kaykai TaxID=54128 RepID=A0ABD2W974_9HYME
MERTFEKSGSHQAAARLLNETRRQKIDNFTLSVKSEKNIAMFPSGVPPPPRAPEDKAGAESIQAPFADSSAATRGAGQMAHLHATTTVGPAMRTAIYPSACSTEPGLKSSECRQVKGPTCGFSLHS